MNRYFIFLLLFLLVTNGQTQILTCNPANGGVNCPPFGGSIQPIAFICPGESINITFTFTDGQAPYTVQYTDGTSIFTVTIPNNHPIPVSPFQTTSYEIIAVCDANDCPGTIQGFANIIVRPPEPAPFDTLKACHFANGEAYFDLTSINFILNNNTSFDVFWYEHPLGQPLPFSLASAYLSGNRTVYAALVDGNCQSLGYEPVELLVQYPPEPEIEGDLRVCPGDIVTFGVNAASFPNHSFEWETGQNTPTIEVEVLDGIDVETLYTITVTDEVGCHGTAQAMLDLANNALQCSTGEPAAGPLVAAEVMIQVGKFPPFLLAWGGGPENSQSIPTNDEPWPLSLLPGTYSLTVTNDIGCVETCDFEILYDCSRPFIIDAVDPSCSGGSDGTISISGAGTYPPFTYQWSDNANLNSAFRTGLPAREYQVTVSDAAGCTNVLPINLVDPPALRLQCALLDTIPGSGENEGNLRFIAEGGTPPYVLRYETPFGLLDSIALQNNPDTFLLQGSGNGAYIAILRDSKACTMECSLEVMEPVCALEISEAISGDISCFGMMDGQIDIEVTGVSNGLPLIDWSEPLPDGQLNLDELGPDEYTVIISDTLIADCDTTLSFSITEPDLLVIDSCLVVEPPSTPTGNGTARIVFQGGSPGYTLIITDQNMVLEEIDIGNDTLANFEKPSGLYQLTVRDNNGCESGCQLVIPEVSCMIEIDCDDVQNVSPPGAGNGSSTVVVSGAMAPNVPFTINWTGPVTGQITAYQDTTFVINNLSEGTYLMELFAGDGACYRTCTFVVDSVLSNDNCGSDYLLSLEDLSACQSVSFDLTNLGATPSQPFPNLSGCEGSSTSISEAADVWYLFRPTQAIIQLTIEGDIATPIAAVFPSDCDPFEPLFCVIGVENSEVLNWEIDFGADYDEDFYLMISGGDLMDQGNFTLTFEAPSEVDILPSFATIGCMETGVLLDAGSDFETYTWSNGATTSSITATTGGPYAITVTDASGCEFSDIVQVTDEELPDVEAGPDMSLECDSTVILEGFSQAQNVTFLWSPAEGIISGENTLLPEVNQPGVYYLTVIGQNPLCRATDSTEVFEGAFVQAEAGKDTSLCGSTYTVQANDSLPPNISGIWTTPGDALISNPNLPITVVENLQPGSNLLIWILSSDFCGEVSRDTLNLFFASITAKPDTFEIGAGIQTHLLDVVENDLLLDSVNWEVSLGDLPKHGTIVEIDAKMGRFFYCPDKSFVNEDAFTYHLLNLDCDSLIQTETVRLTRGRNPFNVDVILVINDDGKNEVFTLDLLSIPEFQNNQFRVYDRWGTLVYEKKNFVEWDGRTKTQKALPTGAYPYILKFSDDNKPPIVGTISIRN